MERNMTLILTDTFNTTFYIIVILFAIGVFCELIKDDRRFVYQFVAFFSSMGMSIITGIELFTKNIEYPNGVILEWPNLGWYILGFGILSFIAFCLVLWQRIKYPYEKMS